jgi:hypothetical protein
MRPGIPVDAQRAVPGLLEIAKIRTVLPVLGEPNTPT